MIRAVLASGLCAISLQATAGVTVTVRLAAPDALEAEYALPAACTRLPFLKQGRDAARIRARWQAQDGCGSAGGDTLARGGQVCPTLRFRVPATTDKVAGYPGSFPVGQALYAHMSNYAVGEECGPVAYRFAGPATIRAAGRSFANRAPAHADASALLFPARQAGAGIDYFDPALSREAVARIRKVADGTTRYLKQAMPQAHYIPPIVAAGLAEEPGGPNIGGSAGDVLLLTLFNWPAEPEPQDQRRVNKLVAHEVSHRFQMRDAVDSYPDRRLIHEGGAEFLRWSVSLRQGWLTPQEAAAELDDALADCMLGTGARSWRAMPAREIDSRRLEYSCGLPAYVYALAARQGEGTPYARLDRFYAQLRDGAWPEFARAMECGEAPCSPRVLPAVLGAGAPMRAQWTAVLDQTGLATPQAPRQSHLDAMMLQAVTQLMQEDCAGGRSITPAPDRILLDTMPKCRTLRQDAVVARAEGLPVFGGTQALPAVVAACAARQVVELGLEDGTTLAMPCKVPYQPMTRVYAADIGKVMAAMGL